jgi:hypothetical protein
MMRIRRQSPQCLVTPCGPFPTPSSWPEHQSRDYNVTTTPDEGTRGMIHVGDMSAALIPRWRDRDSHGPPGSPVAHRLTTG